MTVVDTSIPALPTSKPLNLTGDPFINSAPAPSVQSQHELAGRGVRLADAIAQQAQMEARAETADDPYLQRARELLRQKSHQQILTELTAKILKMEARIYGQAD